MTRTFSVAGFLAVLLLAFLVLRITSGAGSDLPPRMQASIAAVVPPDVPLVDPVAQAAEELAAWPIAAAPAR